MEKAFCVYFDDGTRMYYPTVDEYGINEQNPEFLELIQAIDEENKNLVCWVAIKHIKTMGWCKLNPQTVSFNEIWSAE